MNSNSSTFQLFLIPKSEPYTISERMEEYMSSTHVNHHDVINNYDYSQKYKGVVPQQNGNWGAQIYANNRRIWLGTFKSEIEAAMAYDRASIKLRSSDAPRNFPWTKIALQESKFQSHHTTDSILSMIKDGTYQSKFDDFWKIEKENKFLNLSPEKRNLGFSCRVLFQKELTPSDVGKLNRLVIPKKHAVRYFPHVPDESSENGGYVNDEVNLSFYDVEKRLWKFRYCYWKSSQSFVFTRGWNQFVKEKKLMAKDKIVFYYHENLEVPNMGFWVIDTCWSSRNIGVGLKLGVDTEEGLEDIKTSPIKKEDEIMERSSVKSKGLKLFGVHIIE